MPLVGLLWLLVHHQINSVKNKMLKEVVKSAQSTSSCFCFDSYVGWPHPAPPHPEVAWLEDRLRDFFELLIWLKQFT